MNASKQAALIGLAARRPVEFIDRVRGRRERHAPPGDLTLSITHEDAIRAAHEVAQVEVCTADCLTELRRVSGDVAARLGADGNYLQTHHDGGPVLSRLLWVLVRHLRPANVVETGVARGVSSAFMLDAMHRNGHGHLWSVDLPPIGNGWSRLVGSAVDPDHRARWTYLRGASRRVLPRVFSTVEPTFFVHDGLHTERTMAWEYAAAWAALPSGGLLISDDIDDSHAWQDFARDLTREWTVAEPGKDGVLAIAKR